MNGILMVMRLLYKALICLFFLFAWTTPSLGIFVSYSSGDGVASVSATEKFDLDSSASLLETTALNSDKLYQSRQASCTGNNSLTQAISGKGYSLENRVDSSGSLSLSASASASSEGASLYQDVVAIGSTSLALQGDQDSDMAGQETSVDYGILSSSQNLAVGQGVSASQSTEMVGQTGRVAAGITDHVWAPSELIDFRLG